MSQEQKEKKPWYKKWWLWVIVALVIIFAIAGGNSSENQQDQTSTTAVESVMNEPIGEETTLTDPELESIEFAVSDVQNDVTGNWRISKISESIIMSDHAAAYYQKYFENDDEIHAIVNFSKGTTTKIMKSPLGIYVATYEYVDGEEHDAKKLFSGMLLTEQYFDSETGEEIEVD